MRLNASQTLHRSAVPPFRHSAAKCQCARCAAFLLFSTNCPLADILHAECRRKTRNGYFAPRSLSCTRPNEEAKRWQNLAPCQSGRFAANLDESSGPGTKREGSRFFRSHVPRRQKRKHRPSTTFVWKTLLRASSPRRRESERQLFGRPRQPPRRHFPLWTNSKCSRLPLSLSLAI